MEKIVIILDGTPKGETLLEYPEGMSLKELFCEYINERNRKILERTLSPLNLDYPSSAFLWALSRALDENYPDHIRESKVVYRLLMDGHKNIVIHRSTGKENYKNYPLFRSQREAALARKYLTFFQGKISEAGGKQKD